MTNKAIKDAEAVARDKLSEAREKATELQHDAQKQAHGIREQAEERAHDLREHAADTAVDAQAKVQGQATKVLRRAERTPDYVYLAAVLASMTISAVMLLRKRRSMSLFVGLWPVTIASIAMMLKNRRVSQEVSRIPSGADVKDELLLEE